MYCVQKVNNIVLRMLFTLWKEKLRSFRSNLLYEIFVQYDRNILDILFEHEIYGP